MSHTALRPTALLGLLTLTACGDDAPTEPVGPAVPTAVITSPASGFAVDEGTPVLLAGSATDPQDGTLGDDALAWSSSIDGALGTGSPLEVA